jgi:FkbM family methyltransferase
VLLQLPGAGGERLVSALLDSVPGGRRRLLSPPPADAPVAAQRDWHRDAWWALSGQARSSVTLVTGSTAAQLQPVLSGRAKVVVLVVEPIAALGGPDPQDLPEARLVGTFAKRPNPRRQARLRPWSNPQSRALLGPWHDTEQLAVTLGPPDDAEHWRRLLFEDVLSRVDASRSAAGIARRLMRALNADRNRAARALPSLSARNSAVRSPLDDRHAELLRSLNWLDRELYQSCSAPGERTDPHRGASRARAARGRGGTLPRVQPDQMSAAGGRVERLRYKPVEVHLHVESEFETRRLRACRKEPWTAAWIEDSLEPGDTFYDIGANVGPFSLVAAKLGRPGVRVVAVEAGAASFASLCRNIVLNGVTETVIPLPISLADQTQLSVFNYSDLTAGAAIHSLGADSPYVDYEPVYRQPVLAFALDDLLERFDLPRPTHVKLDTDGSELRILKGARKALSNDVRSLMIEMEEGDAGGIVALLRDAGFELVERNRRRRGDAEVTTHSYGRFVKR